MTAQTKPAAGPDAAYRTLIGHTYSCATCRAGASCPAAVQLGREWRAVRGRSAPDTSNSPTRR